MNMGLGSSDFEVLKNLLTRLGIEKLYIVDKEVDKMLFLGIYTGQQFLILAAKGEYSWYSKVVFADSLLEPYWRCEYLTYFPEGLYVFAKDVHELATNIVKTLNKLIKSRIKNSAVR